MVMKTADSGSICSATWSIEDGVKRHVELCTLIYIVQFVRKSLFIFHAQSLRYLPCLEPIFSGHSFAESKSEL